ncbi:MAG TPA: family 16 glycoside hydrolase [Bacteroidales bacterium]|nr:family 16 glycoside hydrolase [Bacteroidales bacterium]
MKRLYIIVFGLFLAFNAFPQDVRTLETKVADLLARMPVYNSSELIRQMVEMGAIGEEGRNMICRLIIPPGSGDDTRARFAIESYSRHLSSYGNDVARIGWEKECICFMGNISDPDVLSFYMVQLQYIGHEASVNFVSNWLPDSQLCEPAVAVISSYKSELSEGILIDALDNEILPCAASVMNTLAKWNSAVPMAKYLKWYSRGDNSIRKSALNAIASSTDPAALKTLDKASSDVNFGWDPTGATSSYLKYARNMGHREDMKVMEKICKKIISGSPENYVISALDMLVEIKGFEAVDYLENALTSNNKEIRMAALKLFNDINDIAVTREMIEIYERSDSQTKVEIIYALGQRGDTYALDLVSSSLTSNELAIRSESALAMVKLSGKDSAGRLIEYLAQFPGEEDQEAGKEALMRISDPVRRDLMHSKIEQVPDRAKATLLEILSAGGESKCFETALQYIGSADPGLDRAAYMSLKDLSSPEDQPVLIELLHGTDNEGKIRCIQDALASAINKIEGAELRSAELLKAMSGSKEKERIIAVLPYAGGAKALNTLLYEFDNGSAEMREACFMALTEWKDYSASYTLFQIAKSGSKTYSSLAFDAYIKLVMGASVSDEQKLLLLRKIMPYAYSPDQKSAILEKLSDVKTFQSLIFLSGYLTDPDLQQSAARSAMSVALPPSGSSTGMYGATVADILKQVIDLLQGDESEYDKEKIRNYLDDMPDDIGFVSMFNGSDLSGWKGLVEDPVSRARMSRSELQKKQEEADRKMIENWSVKDGAIWFNGIGANLCSVKKYADFEMLVDWKISKDGDSGIYLRGSPQVQIWDTSRVEVGAQVGSGGLYNNQRNESRPLVVADNPVGDWNTFRIIMAGEQVSVWLNGTLVVDDVVMENYWDRSIPIFPEESIELQAHGNELAFRDIYIREIRLGEYILTPVEKADGFIALFNGRDLDNWIGNKEAYVAEDGQIVIRPTDGDGGNLYTENEYADFNFRFEFQLTPGANNGLGIRTPLTGNAAYVGMELQIIDNTTDIFGILEPFQFHGSIYGVSPARRGFLRPVGEWNEEEVIVNGTHITVILNGATILDADIADARDNGTIDQQDHPGLKRDTGHIAFLGHGSVVKFRNIRIKVLERE